MLVLLVWLAVVPVDALSLSSMQLRSAVANYCVNQSSAVEKYGEIETWDVSVVTDMAYLFCSYSGGYGPTRSTCMCPFNVNPNISAWNVSRVTTMRGMFADAVWFNADIRQWDVSRVTDMQHMFENTHNINANIGTWDVSSVHSMNNMFEYADFNADLSRWDVSRVVDMSSMFADSTFNADINSWNTSSARNMDYMFAGSDFRIYLSDWDVTGVSVCQSLACVCLRA